LATIAIKGKASSSKSLFPNLPKHTCLMAKERKKKVKSKASSSPKYVTSDEDTLNQKLHPLSNMSLVIKILSLVLTMLLVMMMTLFLVNL
jgi:hypothetical protein